jgi:hypothetical protein
MADMTFPQGFITETRLHQAAAMAKYVKVGVEFRMSQSAPG